MAVRRSERREPGDPRRGHGTQVVSEVASAHRGRFALCETGSGCVAALELPLGRARLRTGGVSRRARALVFLTAALICAALAATVAGRYRSRMEARYGPLRPVVVATAELPAGQTIGVQRAGTALSVRRVPATFVPPGALTRPADALGRAPGATIPAGSYVLGAQLALPQTELRASPEWGGAPARPGRGRRGRGAHRRRHPLRRAAGSTWWSPGRPASAAPPGPASRRQRVKLLALRSPPGPGEGWSATLAVTEQQALSLIGAQSAGREIRLLPQS